MLVDHELAGANAEEGDGQNFAGSKAGIARGVANRIGPQFGMNLLGPE